ncbi:MAG: molybdopterin-binding protein, partial [Treponema sp.]|nr:molybdopterin-binding protein [Treponema sp.]
MKLIKTADATGHILCHDMTEVIPGISKGTRFRRGHIITAPDIPVLLDMGKEQLYVWEKQPGFLHEEEGAEKLCEICRGSNIKAAPPREGKIELFAEKSGLFKIDPEKILSLNMVEGLAVITLKRNCAVKEGDKIAALKIIPLLIEEEKLKLASYICGGDRPINIIPYKGKKAGLIVTGNEIFKNRIKDTGSEILKKKIAVFGAECAETVIVPDDCGQIAAAIVSMVEKGINLIICSGGMSVDPDDKTPEAIRKTGARVVSQGVPFQPGVMLMLS